MAFWTVNIGDVLGIGLAVVGFGLTFREARRARQSADRAVARVTTARRLSDALEISSSLAELAVLVSSGRNDAAMVLCAHARDAVTRLYAEAARGSATHQNALWIVGRLSAIHRRLARTLSEFELETTIQTVREARYRLLLIAEEQRTSLGGTST